MGGARGVAALVVLLFASALLIGPASGRVLEGGDKPSSGKETPAPTTVVASGSTKTTQAVKESEQPKKDQAAPAPSVKDKTQPSTGSGENQGQAGGEAQGSASPPPPTPPPPPKNEKKASPPPGGQGPNSGEETKGPGKDEGTNKMKEVMDKCDESHKCSSSGKEFSACLQVSDTASVGSFIIVHNQGQNDITVNITEPSVYSGTKPLKLIGDAFGKINIKSRSPDGENITLHGGNGDCVIHVQQSGHRQSVSDWQQQFPQFAEFTSRLNPIYGASFLVFTIVLVGGVCACCKFARKSGSEGVPYQQLEMGAQAPNSTAVENTTNTTDGWEDGWDDDWDDEEAPARPSDKKPTSSVSTNGLSLRSQTNSKDGWDVDWDD